MQGMRQVDGLVASLARIASAPSSRGGYEELMRCYVTAGRTEEAEAVSFLISEKFRANGTDTDAGQQGDHREVC